MEPIRPMFDVSPTGERLAAVFWILPIVIGKGLVRFGNSLLWLGNSLLWFRQQLTKA